MDLRRLAAWAAPWTVAECVACRAPLPLGTGGFCAGCDLSVEPLHGEVDRLGERGRWLVAALRYGGPVADALAAMKFHGAPPDLGALTPAWAATCGEVAQVTAIEAWVAVPPQPERLVARGWHLPDLLAATVAAATRRPAPLLLERRDRQAPRAQGATSLPEFRLRRDAGRGPRRVGLVDDIVTTGATAQQAIATLESAGFEVVCLAVLADARPRTQRVDDASAGAPRAAADTGGISGRDRPLG